MDESQFVISEVDSFSHDLLETVRSLAQQEGRNYKDLSNDDLKEIIDSSSTYLYIAKEVVSDKIVGMVTLVLYRIPYVRKASMEDLVVDESYRGRGIGTMLIEKVLKEAGRKGAAYIDFTSRPRREGENSMYEKLGFQKRETNIYRHIFDYGEV